MLSIKTDLKETHWLKYILKEFQKINLADFDIEVISLSVEEKYNNIVYYTTEVISNEINIFNCNEIVPNGEIEYITEQLYILARSQNKSFNCSYDIFWNAFVFLSRYEEYISEKNGKRIYSYSLNHPRIDKNSFDIPIVNILFNEFEKLLKENFNDLEFAKREEAIIDLSHDVDYINKTFQLRLKQTAFNGFNTIKSISQPKKFFKNLQKTIKFAFSNPSYWCFDYWENIEKKYNKRSTFYIYVKNGKKDFKSWLIDPSYDISKNIQFQNKLKQLYKDGFDIGIHGSYYSALDYERLKQEKDIIEKILDIKIEKTRQHWLNYIEDITPYSHMNLFKVDSTLAWNDRIGFRSGIANRYNPFDFKNNCAFGYEVVPQVIMDSNVFDYVDDDGIFKRSKDLIELSKNISKCCNISISWHQRVCSSDYNWHKFYEELLDDI